jgi:DNA polymerase (family X)
MKDLAVELNIKNVSDLEDAARSGKISKVTGFGKRWERRILRELEKRQHLAGRKMLGDVLPVTQKIERIFRSYPGLEEFFTAGSVRRRKETVNKISFVGKSSHPYQVIDKIVGSSLISHLFEQNNTHVRVRLKNGLDADFYVVEKHAFGAVLLKQTGSKEHYEMLQDLARKKDWDLSDEGLFAGVQKIAGSMEEEIYNLLGLRYIEPELREARGEIEASARNQLPELIHYGELRGDLQVQTNWTDGTSSIEEMALQAQMNGLEYIAITDHTKSLAITRGLDEMKLLKQREEIQFVNKKLESAGSEFKILSGAEVNILKDGSLDIDDSVLEQLEVVGASIHSHFHLTKEEQTERVLRAMRNPNVDIIFHLSGRLINRRNPVELDIDQIINCAKETNTVLEINSLPDRLDLKDEWIKKCRDAEVKMCIDSDAHHPSNFSLLDYGIDQARRGWASRKDILNTLPVREFVARLK